MPGKNLEEMEEILRNIGETSEEIANFKQEFGKTPEDMKAILRESGKFGEEIVKRFGSDFHRVNNLLTAYDVLSMVENVNRDDILRSAVVLLHAILEDTLRTNAVVIYPTLSKEVIDTIPLAGFQKRPGKISLGDLAEFRGKNTDEIIKESVYTYFQESNFNSTRDIADLITKIGLNCDEFRQYFPLLSDMISRRHRIVHLGDRIELSIDENLHPENIEKSLVLLWITNTCRFVFSFTQNVFKIRYREFYIAQGWE